MRTQTNQRKDDYSCTSSHELNFLHRIVTSIRAVVPSNFVVGVKINASDYVDSSVTQGSNSENNKTAGPVNNLVIESHKEKQETRALGHVRSMAGWHSLDFIEVSGGDYETPGM